jgi:dipeptidyl aminopeptidase/acylaminoacyl peptidase
MSNLIKAFFMAICLMGSLNDSYAQESLEYQKPPQEILDLVDVDLAPFSLITDDREYMVFVYRKAYKSIVELSETEMRLGGLRINPKTNIGSRTTFYTNLKVMRMGKDEEGQSVKGMPENPRISNISWSPDQSKMAFTHTTTEGNELWYLDLKKAEAKRLTGPVINANMGNAVKWFRDGKSILIKQMSDKREELIDVDEAIPSGPTVSTNDGAKAQNRTYQDLLKNPNDEHNFEQLARSSLKRVDLKGEMSDFLGDGMYASISFSPDGEYIMINQVHRPFSYIVPYNRFPTQSTIYTTDAQKVAVVMDVPLMEEMPKGFMSTRTGRRNMSWRADRAHTLYYAEALDGGDPEKEVEYRDEVFELEAPFTGEGSSIFKSINRFSGISWANDNLAVAYDYWWNTRNTKMYFFNPSDPSEKARIVFDRNYQDQYSDPGSFVSEPGKYPGYSLLSIRDNKAFMTGPGYSEEGQFPFLREMDLKSLETKTLYKSAYTDKLESISDYFVDEGKLLVRIESKNEYPNYYMRDLKSNTVTAMTQFPNPFAKLENVQKEVIEYKREDGLDLSGTLYLPLDYEEGKRYPMILWAYPREFKDKASAGQNTQNPNEFVYPFWGSPIYWVTRGYVVLDDASFPIIGEGDEEPNDSFRPQLVSNAKAAIDALDQRGLVDPKRVAVGGHSYGAFMVANLLTHSDLFAAGIARSGAYNRTLTPFGFQSEERSYWDAPEVYYTMSPFMHADKMKTPLLLIHGEADNNSGTYPLQSERYFNALKGLGATVRLVMLPKESHGYSARESILHLLWEQDEWMDTYVKNRKD